jgi:hypothetical protein
MWALLREDSRRGRIAVGLAIYVLSTAVFFAFAAGATLRAHTPWNHFALLAEAWLEGRLDLAGPPPPYAGNNDFASFHDRWFVVFPPFPALLLLPLVAWARSAVRVQDGQFFIWLAGIAPAVLFLALEKLRRHGRTERKREHNVALALLFAWGTVYFFTAEQGTVWYAAHVVGAGLAALYLFFALEAERPLLAGLMLSFGFLTRPPLLFAAPLFLLEAWRVCAGPGRQVDWRRLGRLLESFALPIVIAVAAALLYNRARFGDPFESGYRYLTVAWQGRMNKWGLFSYHYLARNLGVVLTSLPYVGGLESRAPLQINGHGLALWITSPFYLWLFWPRRTAAPFRTLALTAACVAVPSLFYQSTGWVQFGFRYANDYAVFLFALFAIGGYRLGRRFWTAAACAVVINGFGALTFGRPTFAQYYYSDPSQKVLYQPD